MNFNTTDYVVIIWFLGLGLFGLALNSIAKSNIKPVKISISK